jgi:spermidine/putrescine-binding protein
MSDNSGKSERRQEFGLDPISRRTLMRRGAGLAALGVTPALLAACGGGGSSSSSSSGSSTASTGGEAAKVGGTIVYFGYEGIDFPKPLAKFNKENGLTVEAKYLTSVTEIPAKFATGGNPEIDVLQFGDPELPFMLTSGVELEALDLEQIPNWKSVERFVELGGKQNYQNENGDLVSVPVSWGSLGITYDSSKIKAPTAWQQLVEPEFKDKITMLDDAGVNYALAAKILGFKVGEMDEAKLKECSEFLKKVIANSKTISPSYGDISNLISTGEVEAVFAGFGLIDALAAESGNTKIRTNIDPEEGSLAFSENYNLPVGAPNPVNAYAMINEVLDSKVNPEAASSIILSSVVEGGPEKQPKSISSLYPSEKEWDSYFAKNELVQNPPAVSDQFITFGELIKEWTQIKTEV